ncbi:hypothetical protein BH10PSE7_BH10PSE7_19390 [soil metagenome]
MAQSSASPLPLIAVHRGLSDLESCSWAGDGYANFSFLGQVNCPPESHPGTLPNWSVSMGPSEKPTEPWTLDPDGPQDRPRGSQDDLTQLLEILGPFQFETNEELDKADSEGRVPRHPGRNRLGWLSKAEAIRQLQLISTALNWGIRKEKNAPRVATVIQALRRIEDDADRLREPPRVFRRPFHLSHVAMAGSSSMA